VRPRTVARAFGGVPPPPVAAGELPPEFDRNRVMSALDIGVGPMYAEEKASVMSMVTYDMAPVQGPFGTFEDPVPILSNFDNRVVACLGGGEREHPILWMQIEGDRKHMCEECGQFFRLYQINTEEDVAKLSEKERESIYLRYKDHLHLPTEYNEVTADPMLDMVESDFTHITGVEDAREKIAVEYTQQSEKKE